MHGWLYSVGINGKKIILCKSEIRKLKNILCATMKRKEKYIMWTCSKKLKKKKTMQIYDTKVTKLCDPKYKSSNTDIMWTLHLSHWSLVTFKSTPLADQLVFMAMLKNLQPLSHCFVDS